MNIEVSHNTESELEILRKENAKLRAALNSKPLTGENIPAGYELRGPTNNKPLPGPNGQLGYWCQGDCIFIEATNGSRAVEVYRQKLTQARIAISSHNPAGLILWNKNRGRE